MIHRQPAVVTDWAGRADFSTQNLGKPFDQFQILRRFDAAPGSYDNFRLAKVNSLFGLPERLSRLGADRAAGHFDGHGSPLGGCGAALQGVLAERTRLK